MNMSCLSQIFVISMKMFLILLVSLLLLNTGCVSRIGDFTMASTKNIDIRKSLHVVDMQHRVRGIDKKAIIILPFVDPKLKEAMDNAEEKAPSCVGLSNVTVKYGFWYIPYLFGEIWYEVEGNPVFEATDGIPEYSSYVREEQQKRQSGPTKRKK